MKSNKKSVWGYILKAPMALLILGSFLVSVYAASYGIQGVTWSTPVIIAIIIGLYYWGVKLHK